MEILGTTINNFTREEIVKRVEVFLDEPSFHQIATINPEFLLEAEKNRYFHTILHNCDLRVVDGFGITLALFFCGEKLRCRFPGADLIKEILHIADQRNLSVYLAVRKDGLSSFDEVKNAIAEKYPAVHVYGESDVDSNDIKNCAIVFCNFGSPAQEIFLAQFRNQTSNIRIAMGVGGSFDYLTGRQTRAPRWLQRIGFEWFWRLLLHPRRWKRIWNAVVVFPFRVFFATMKK